MKDLRSTQKLGSLITGMTQLLLDRCGIETHPEPSELMYYPVVEFKDPQWNDFRVETKAGEQDRSVIPVVPPLRCSTIRAIRVLR